MRERRLTITILSPPTTLIPSLRDIPWDFLYRLVAPASLIDSRTFPTIVKKAPALYALSLGLLLKGWAKGKALARPTPSA